jgi:hypothetical protein
MTQCAQRLDAIGIEITGNQKIDYLIPTVLLDIRHPVLLVAQPLGRILPGSIAISINKQ